MRPKESNGVLSRLIENWLINTTERGFEIPLATILRLDGYSIIHIDSHSSYEQGKDIIAISPDNLPCGFQIKQGNVTGSRWDREIFPELNQLVEAASWHSKVKGKLLKPFLVITGFMNEPAALRFKQYNEGLACRGFQAVELIDQHQLCEKFAKAFGSFLPLELTNFQRLLKFYLTEASSNLDKQEFFDLISDFPDARSDKGAAKKLINALPILCAYAISPANKVGNHYAQIEAWALTASKIAYLSMRHSLAKKDWFDTYLICRNEAIARVHELSNESIKSKSLLAGSVLGDGGYLWKYRLTILLGIVAASYLISRFDGRQDVDKETLELEYDFVLRWMGNFLVWGESANASAWMIFWLVSSKTNSEKMAENFLLAYALSIVIANSSQKTGLAVPHLTLDEILEEQFGVNSYEFKPKHTYSGNAYSVRPVVCELARKLCRTSLEASWSQISEIQYSWMSYKNQEDYLEYRVIKGVTRSSYYDRPTSWKKLLKESQKYAADYSKNLPRILLDDLQFAMLFALVFPHRLDVYLTANIGNHLSEIE